MVFFTVQLNENTVIEQNNIVPFAFRERLEILQKKKLSRIMNVPEVKWQLFHLDSH